MILEKQNNKLVYSDGEVTEAEMLSLAKKYPEDTIQDAIANDCSYTLNNTFSSVRENVLNWYPFKKNADILEVGAGMGSITGMLCNKANSVTALEMNKNRAEVIKARYPERDNLTVISCNINDWKTDKKFDYIVFIGVLEYAAIFSEDEKPFHEFLNSLKRFIKEDGILLFAIENRFGLKYWLGASEDHLQKPFVGIQGYKEKKTAQTFSKNEIKELVEEVGFSFNRIYSILPDYRFPELIFSEDYVPDYMNLQKVSYTYAKNSSLIMNEKELYKDLVENRVFDFFANSFLVEASQKDLGDYYIKHVSSKAEVKKKYRVSTIIDNKDNVFKYSMHKDSKLHVENIYSIYKKLSNKSIKMVPCELIDDICIKSPFVKMNSSQHYFLKLIKNNDFTEVINMIKKLKATLLMSAEIQNDITKNILFEYGITDKYIGDVLVDGYIDMTLYNSFWEENNFVFFDQEWKFDNVPLDFMLFYNIKLIFERNKINSQITKEYIFKELNISEEKQKWFTQLEEKIWGDILYRQDDFYGKEGYCNRFNEDLLLSKKEENLIQNNIELNNEKDELEKKLNEEKKKLNEEKKKLNEEKKKLNEEKKENELLVKEKQQLNEKTQELAQSVKNHEGHIELLLEVEREFEREKQTKGYKFIVKVRSIPNKVFPQNSKRRFFAHLAKMFLKNPVKFLKLINKQRIKNCIILLFRQGGKDVIHHVERIEQYENEKVGKRENLEIEDIDFTKTFEELEQIDFKKEDKPEVSIIIPVYNEFLYTYNCLKSIKKNTFDVKFEIIIANDNSSDFTKRIHEKVNNIVVIDNSENLRFLKNCNNSSKYAKGKYILFLNNDTQVLNNWLKPLIDIMEKDKSIGMVGSKLIYSDGKLQEAGGIMWKDATAWNYGNGSNPEFSDYNFVHEIDYISGAALMIRTDLWNAIGGFDERYSPAYCEDSDLAFEVRRKGYKVVYQPLSEVVHFEGISNGTNLSEGQKKYQVINQDKFLKKWKKILEKEHFPNGVDVFLARDRSREKKHILFIDHYVPQYDKDAGSKTTLMYLKMLVNKGFSITFLGDNFYYDEHYTKVLQQLGIFVLYGPYYAENIKEWLIENLKYYSFVYLNRPHISIKYIDLVKNNSNAKIIYYGHDLHFMRSAREYELTKNEALLKEIQEWKKQELYLMKQADISFYPSELEIQEVKKIDPNIAVQAITAYTYEKFLEIEYIPEEREGILFVGGFGHSPNIDAVEWFLDKIFPSVYQETKAPFYIVGSKAPDNISKIKQDGVIFKGYVSEEELAKLYSSCRVCVVPLRYGAGVKGKVVEALYYGLPIITTSIGAEGIESIDKCVCIEDKPEDFIEALCSLYTDVEKLTQMTIESQKLVKDKFSVEAVWKAIKVNFE